MFADAVIVGAGPAGLAAAQRLQSQGLKPLLLEKAAEVGAAWRRHYDRLHLHTPRLHSNLPGLAMPRAYGRYPSRAQFVDYLEAYAERFRLKPSFRTPVGAIRRSDRRWAVETPTEVVTTPIVVVADGLGGLSAPPALAGNGAVPGPAPALQRLSQRRGIQGRPRARRRLRQFRRRDRARPRRERRRCHLEPAFADPHPAARPVRRAHPRVRAGASASCRRASPTP